MPIDKNFRSMWDKTSHTKPYQIWTSRHDGGEIHGSIVGVYIDGCIGCLKCLDACPTDVFEINRRPQEVVVPEREDKCIFCLVCEIICPTYVINVDKQVGSEKTLDSLLGDV